MAAWRKLTDDQLVALFKEGDQQAFSEIYVRYGESLAGFAASKLYNLDDARDILQDMFVKLWENREQVHITSTLQSYLFAIIRHRIIDKIRKNVTREGYAEMVQSLREVFEPAADQQLEAKQLRQNIETSLGELPPRVKEIYKLSRDEGLSNREIADKLDLSEQTVKNQLTVALKHLRKVLSTAGIFIICWLLTTFTACAMAQQRSFNQPLADSFAKWVQLDQTAAGPAAGRFKDMTSAQRTHYSDSVFAADEQRLKIVFSKYGFPGYDLVGQKGSNNFWLMTQHCDKDVAFQQRILAAMKQEVAKHNADPQNFAYLTDRVNINTGQKQIYGTQVTYRTDSCQAIPRPMADSLHVDERRKAIGMETIEAYLNTMSQLHFDMNKAVYEKKGIYKPKLISDPH